MTTSRVRLVLAALSIASFPLPLLAQTFEEQVVALVNQERLNNGGLPPLKSAPELMSSAETHSSDMAVREFFSHCDLDTLSQPWDRMTAAGYTWSAAAENIAAGQTTPADVMTSWMNSSGHRANILSSSYREIGVGYVLQAGDTNNIRFNGDGDCVFNPGNGSDFSNQGPFFRYWTQNFGRRSNHVANQYPLVIEREAYLTTTRKVALYIYAPAGVTRQMRFSNDSGVTWSSFELYNTVKNWTLARVNGVKTVSSETVVDGITYAGQDSIVLADPCDVFCSGFEVGSNNDWSSASP